MSDNNMIRDYYEMLAGQLSYEKGVRMLDSVVKKADEFVDLANESKPMLVHDSYGNSLTSIGSDDKVQPFTSYGLDNSTNNWMLWLSLYSFSWVFKRAIDKPAEDEVNCGITLMLTDGADKVQKELRKHSSELMEILQWGALFGGSVGIMMFDNVTDDQMCKPMNVKNLNKVKRMRIYVTDRWYGCSCDTNETVTDITSEDFGKPKYYDITFADGHQIRVHHDYVLRYEHRDAPKLEKNGRLMGWGYAEGSHILNELSRDDQLKASITSLINKSLIEVIKMPGMRGVFMGSDKDNEQQLRKRLEMVNWARNFNSLTFLDKDDEYQQNTFGGLGGLADLLSQSRWDVAAALDMPGVLYGDLKGGISVDAAALTRYSSTIKNRCMNWYKPVLDKLLKVIYLMNDIHETVEYEFNSIYKVDENAEKIGRLSTLTSLMSQMLADGYYTPKQAAKTIKKYSEKDVLDLNIDDKDIEELSDETNNMLEGLDLGNEEPAETNETNENEEVL